MTFLLALVGVIAVGFLLWRAFGPQLVNDDDEVTERRVRTRGPVGPDDDPEFLQDLDRRARGGNEDN
ncbi:hypothetical protein ACWDTD_10195 [Gordonia sp. NPDC003425]